MKHFFFGLAQPKSKCFTPPWVLKFLLVVLHVKQYGVPKFANLSISFTTKPAPRIYDSSMHVQPLHPALVLESPDTGV
jgi:hypothetical protein